MATHPFSSWRTQEVDTDEERYEALADRYRLLVREQVICGCHVHVGNADPHDRVAVLKAARAWLPTLHRKRVVKGQRVSRHIDLGVRRIIKKQRNSHSL